MRDNMVGDEGWIDEEIGHDGEETSITNHEYGTVGDKLEEDKEENTVRIYFQNINGMKWDSDGGAWPGICQAMATIQADIVGFAEVNYDTSKFEIKQKLDQIAGKYFDRKKVVAGTSNRIVKRNFKPGGTLMMTVMNMVGAVKEITRDRMGRWVSTRYQGTNPQRLTIIMAYQVCQNKRTGKNTAVNQQINMILEESAARNLDTRMDPRQAFITDLTQFITQRQTEGDNIILLGDFNETMTENQSGIARLAITCGLSDIYNAKFRTVRQLSTYKRSNRRIDFALASPAIHPSIQKVGYDPFDYRGIFSDHRGLFIDLNIEVIMGNRPIQMMPKQHRDFTADNPAKVVQYIERKYKELTNHNLITRIEYLESLLEPNHEWAERLDRDMVRAATIAAKAVKTKYKTPWSPTLAKAWANLHLCKMVKSQIQNQHLNNWESIQEWQRKHDMKATLPRTLEEAKANLREAQELLKTARQEADNLRQAHLDDKALLYATSEDKDKENVIRRIKRAEDLKNCYRKLRYIRNESDNLGIRELQVPRDNAMDPKQCPSNEEFWTTVTVPNEIKQLLLLRNKKHFGQAHGTPLTDPEFLAEVKYDGSGMAADMILEGSYDTKDLDAASQLFVKHMTRQTTTELPSEITKEEFLSKLRNWPEKTSTSPSGIHLGHYQALWQRHNIDPKQPAHVHSFEQKRDTIIRAHLALLNYSVKFGYPYRRWHKVVNIMLKKDSHNTFIHRLRVIHLYEADYNLLLAVKWRQAMQHAENQNLLNEGLYGSRQGRSAHDPVFMEVLQNETYKASMKSGINKDLDATSCYDRILAWIANICSRRVGLNKTVALVNTRNLERAEYHLKTEIDISDEFYKHCDTYPIYGTGQGSGNSPHLWCFVASALFDAYAEKAQGATFYSYDSTKSIRIFMMGFVDDCCQRVNDFRAHPQPTAAHLVSLMKKDAQLWNDLLWSSGGALEIPKCSFQVIESDWTQRGKPFLKGQCTAPPLIISNNEGHIRVQQTSNYKARRSLGIQLSPSGMMNQQYETLLAKSRKYAELAVSNAMTRREARIMYHGIYIPSITYPFAVTSLTEGQCRAIETPFARVIIPRCGYNRSMSRSIRNLPVRYGGAGFLNLHVEQSIQTVLMAIKHLRSPSTQVGRMLLIAITWAQAYTGVSWSLWEHPERQIPPIPMPWIDGVRKALNIFDAKIILASQHIAPRLRQYDWYIMDKALSIDSFSKSEIEDINAFRRFYQATTAADISDDMGLRIREEVWKGEGNPIPEDYSVEFFNQPRPNDQARRTWKKFLSQIVTRSRYLREPLGSWMVTHTMCRRRPTWIFHPGEKQLYMRQPGNTYARCPQAGTRYTRPHSQSPSISIPAATAVPVAVLDLGPEVIIRQSETVALVPPAPVTEFREYVATLEQWEQQLLDNVTMTADPKTTAELINEGTELFIASDGSVLEDKYASFGFIITHKTSQRRLAYGKGPAPGANPSSFRAEAYGALAAGRFLTRLSEMTGIIMRQQIIHWIDNQSVVKRLQRDMKHGQINPNWTLQPDWDVLHATIRTLENLTETQYTAKWVKSHQDQQLQYNKLSLEAQMNCDADQQAMQYHNMAQGRQSRKLIPMLPHTHAQLEIMGETITTHYKQALRRAALLPPYYQYLKDRFSWDNHTITAIDWELTSLLVAPYDNQRPTLVKHIHGFAPTGKYAHRNNPYEPAGCPTCQCLVETNEHILACDGESRRVWRQKVFDQLLRDREMQTSSDNLLWDILFEGIMGVLQGDQSGVSIATYPREYHRLITTQNAIGWIHLFRCRWSTEWKACYKRWASSTNKGHQDPGAKAATWVHQRGRTLITSWWELWNIRNKERHGRDQELQSKNQRLVVKAQLEDIYSKRNNMMQVDRALFPYETASEHLESDNNLNSLQDWCLDNMPAVLASCHQAKTRGIAGTGDIRGFLQTTYTVLDSATLQREAGTPAFH